MPTSYTRHWLNFVILYSVWFEFDLIPYASSSVPPINPFTHVHFTENKIDEWTPALVSSCHGGKLLSYPPSMRHTSN